MKIEFSKMAARSSGLASDIEVFAGGLRAGLNVEQCTNLTAANSSLEHQEVWHQFHSRLERGLDIYSTVYDLKELAKDFGFDSFFKSVVLARRHNLADLHKALLLQANFLRLHAQQLVTGASRIKAASGVALLALASPWLLLLLLSSRPENVDSFMSTQGFGLLVSGAIASLASVYISKQLSKRRSISRQQAPSSHDSDLFLADSITHFAFVLKSGSSIRAALQSAAEAQDKAVENIFSALADQGLPETGVREMSEQVRSLGLEGQEREFLTKLILADSLGTVSAEEFIAISESIRHRWLAGDAVYSQALETRLLLPSILISLPLTVIFALFPSLSLLGSQTL